MLFNSVLAELIEDAVIGCMETGEGTRDDDEGLGFRVVAEWCESGDEEYPSVVQITIFQNGVLKLSYVDPTTKCK